VTRWACWQRSAWLRRGLQRDRPVGLGCQGRRCAFASFAVGYTNLAQANVLAFGLLSLCTSRDHAPQAALLLPPLGVYAVLVTSWFSAVVKTMGTRIDAALAAPMRTDLPGSPPGGAVTPPGQPDMTGAPGSGE
jgi:hypothetical protein